MTNYWVRLKIMEQMFGYTANALRLKISRGYLIENVHWRKAPDGNLIMNHTHLMIGLSGNSSNTYD